MDLNAYRRIQTQIDAKIEAVFREYGLAPTKRRVTIDEEMGVVRYNLTLNDLNLKDEKGNPTTTEQALWVKMAPLYGLPLDAINKLFKYGRFTYKIMGMVNTRSPNKVIVELDGKRYGFEPYNLKALIEKGNLING